jgi:hypothetical protein
MAGALGCFAFGVGATDMANAWFTRDDAYYYFKVAQNITEGRGVTFDGINATNGYHPLWLLVCIPVFALARFDLILPLRVLLVLIAAIHATTVVLLFRLLRGALSTPIAALAAAYWAFDLRLHFTFYEFGLETPLAALALVWLLSSLGAFEQQWRTEDSARATRRIASLGAVATVMVLARLDLIFVAIAAGAWIVLRGRPARFLLPLDVLSLVSAMLGSHAAVAGFPRYFDGSDAAVFAAAIFSIFTLVLLSLLGMYQHPRSLGRLDILARSAVALVSSTLSTLGLLWLLGRVGWLSGASGQAVAAAGVVSLVSILVIRAMGRSGGEQAAAGRIPVGTAGYGRSARHLMLEAGAFFGPLGGTLAVYVAVNRIAFGTWLPISAQIKRWWGTQLHTIYDGPPRDMLSFFGLGFNSPLNAWQPASEAIPLFGRHLRFLLPGSAFREERYLIVVVAALLLCMIILLLRRRTALRAVSRLGLIPLGLGAAMHLISYTALGYAGYKEWYWIAQALLLTFVAALLLHLLSQGANRTAPGRHVFGFATGVISVLLAAGLARTIYIKMPFGRFAPDRPYMEVLPFIEENTRPGEVIGMTGGGNAGYFIRDRTVVNMDGLISSVGYFEALKGGTAAEYLSQRGVKVIFANPGLLALPPYNGQFAPYLERYGEYYGKALLWLWPHPKYPESQ